jgi:predicted phage baseplate assembly protein
VGAGSVAYLALQSGPIDGITVLPRNPLPGRGGIEPQPVLDAKLFAPYVFRTILERAVVPADYAALATAIATAREQRAAASLSWTGSWYEADVAVHELGTAEPEPELVELVSRGLERYRRMGHDLRVAGGQAVALDLELTICVLPHYLKAHVAAALLDRFSNQVLGGGRRGFFHPDNLGLGEGIYVSRLVAAAQAVEGVESVEVSRLRRLFGPDAGGAVPDALSIGPLEVARLDNDPANPDNGRLALVMRGGR